MINKEKLQQALIIVYNNDVLVPEINYDWGTFAVRYTYDDMHYGVMLSILDIEQSYLTLEKIAHDVKSHVVVQIEDEIYKQIGGVYYDHQ